MLTYSFSNIGTDSLYSHLYKSIKNDIVNGVLQSGYKLPSKRTFAKNLNISTITIENAYSQLMAEGYIYSIPKKGYFVSSLNDFIHVSDKTAAFDYASSKSESNSGVEAVKSIPETSKPEYIADFLSNNINHENFPFSTWAKLLRETISEDKESLMTVSPSGGTFELRTAIANHLLQFRGMNVKPEQIIVGAGTKYLYGIIIQLLGRDMVYAVEDPGYKKISQIYNSNQVVCEFIPVKDDGININSLEDSGADVIHLSPSHHFPTGIVTPVSRRYELLGWAARASKHQRYIIEDDYDSEFRLLGRPIPSLQSIDVMERAIYMNSFSKSLTSTIRISYMVLPQHLMERYDQMLSFYSCTVSTFEQYTLAKFITEGYFEKHINRMRNYYRNLRDILVEEIKNSPMSDYCTILEADSGLHFLLKIDTSLSDETIKLNATKNGLNLSCLSDYYFNNADGQEHVLIINYSGIREDTVHEAIIRLVKCF